MAAPVQRDQELELALVSLAYGASARWDYQVDSLAAVPPLVEQLNGPH